MRTSSARWLLLVVLALSTDLGCHTADSSVCFRHSDCDADKVCRAGHCVVETPESPVVDASDCTDAEGGLCGDASSDRADSTSGDVVAEGADAGDGSEVGVCADADAADCGDAFSACADAADCGDAFSACADAADCGDAFSACADAADCGADASACAEDGDCAEADAPDVQEDGADGSGEATSGETGVDAGAADSQDEAD